MSSRQNFTTELEAIHDLAKSIDPISYGRTRNYGDGAVTRLGPYISRGVLSTRQVYEDIKKRGIHWDQAKKLVQELAWRDYWQLQWIELGDEIFSDLRQKQVPVQQHGVPKAIVNGNTGINNVDDAISQLYHTGYMHNHMRMYVASICCNIAQCHWLEPARWLYSHLKDGDLASNHLSWQWVAGSNSHKKYYANQDNINKYFGGSQKGTFLDVGYDQFEGLDIPDILQTVVQNEIHYQLPTQNDQLQDVPSLIYNYYNLDPGWHKEESFQRILLWEPELLEEHPITQSCIDFAMDLSQNIPDLKIFVGSFEELSHQISTRSLRFKEHPLNKHYKGIEEPRDWMTSVRGRYPSFFGYWKKAEKQLRW